MDKNGKRRSCKKGGINMNAVLSLDDYKLNSAFRKKQKSDDGIKFFNDNIDDIVDLELNDTGIDEFLGKFMKKE